MSAPHIRRTKNFVTMTSAGYDEVMQQRANYARLAQRLSEQLEEERQLLHVALCELAAKRLVRERDTFVRQWLREHRHYDNGGVPIEER